LVLLGFTQCVPQYREVHAPRQVVSNRNVRLSRHCFGVYCDSHDKCRPVAPRENVDDHVDTDHFASTLWSIRYSGKSTESPFRENPADGDLYRVNIAVILIWIQTKADLGLTSWKSSLCGSLKESPPNVHNSRCDGRIISTSSTRCAQQQTTSHACAQPPLVLPESASPFDNHHFHVVKTRLRASV